jgi:hypothetical protein
MRPWRVARETGAWNSRAQGLASELVARLSRLPRQQSASHREIAGGAATFKKDNMIRHTCVSLLSIIALAMLGCSRPPAQSPIAGQGQGGAPPVDSSSKTVGVATPLLGGADQQAIRTYLQTVKSVKPTRFSVRWSEDTVAVDRDAAIRALQGINEDGSLYTFAASEPIAQRLQPGNILWIWGITLRRIDGIVRTEDQIIVRTKPVALTEALVDSDIGVEAPVDFSGAYIARKAPEPTESPQNPKRAAYVRPPMFRQVSTTQPDNNPAPPREPGSQPGDELPPPDPDDPTKDVAGPTHSGTVGKFMGFEYSLNYKVMPSQLSFELQARKEEEGTASGETDDIHRDQLNEYLEHVAEYRKDVHEERVWYNRVYLLDQQLHASGQLSYSSSLPSDVSGPVHNDWVQQRATAIKEYNKYHHEAEEEQAKIKQMADAKNLMSQVFELVSDNLDARFRAHMTLDRAAFVGNIASRSSALKQFEARFNDMKGRLDLEVVGRLGKPGNGGVSVPVVNLPVTINIPVPVEGIPLVVQFGANFLFKLAVSGKNATLHWTGHYLLAGGGGVSAGSTSTNAEGSAESGEPEVGEKTAMSPGTSGAVVAVQLPRIGLGLGLMGTTGMAYMDIVTVLTALNSAAVATLNPPCKRFTLDRIMSVGVDVSVVPIPIPLVTSAASKKLSQRKEVWRAKQWKVIEPDAKVCQLQGD